MMSLVTLFKVQVLREFCIYARNMRTIFNTSLFFLMIMIFFPLSMPSDKELLRLIVPGFVWVAMLLSLFLSSDRLFQQEYDDGVIEQWLVSSYPLSVFVGAKMLMHWILNLLPMLLLCPIVALLFGLSGYETLVLMLSLLCGTPSILCLCALSSVFGVGLKQKGVLMALILLPLAIPIMIFGSSTMLAAMQGLAVSGYLALLLALSLLCASMLPMAVAFVMRVSLVN